jgi:hypothetical protein
MNASFSKLAALGVSQLSPLGVPESAQRAQPGRLFGGDVAEAGVDVMLRGEVEPQARGLSVTEHAERVVSQLLGEMR